MAFSKQNMTFLKSNIAKLMAFLKQNLTSFETKRNEVCYKIEEEEKTRKSSKKKMTEDEGPENNEVLPIDHGFGCLLRRFSQLLDDAHCWSPLLTAVARCSPPLPHFKALCCCLTQKFLVAEDEGPKKGSTVEDEGVAAHVLTH
ncbi:unnamed protein product [Cuscuta epithymum]|uniref:Uncharacterized protein n=1 Tax=Cuscuta epithymum TaxID=186058 RepID=A0AAV0FSD1_9ASTE|nr:unnamed protein product [Cuscuta epithymum]